MSRSLFLCVLISVAPLTGQGSYVNYGQGCNSFGTPPHIYALAAPKIGSALLVGGLFGTVPFPPGRFSVIGYLATGTSRTSYQGLPLPLRIPPS